MTGISELERRCIDAGSRVAYSDDHTYRLRFVRAVLAEAGVAELVEALKPFAQEAKCFGVGYLDHDKNIGAPVYFNVGDLRRAHAALTQEQPR